MVTAGDDGGGMATPDPARVCVVTVHDGPHGVRWAEVSLRGGVDLVTRTRHTAVADVLAQVRGFLVAAGLTVASRPPPDPEPTAFPGRPDDS